MERGRKDERKDGEGGKENVKGMERGREGDPEEGASWGQQGRVGDKHGNEQRSVCSLRVGKREGKHGWRTC